MKSVFKSRFLTICALTSVIMLTACDKSKNAEINPTSGLIKVIDGYALGAAAKVEVYTKEKFFAGYNKLYFALYDSMTGKRITNSHIHLNPVMKMMNGSHSCPREDPDENAINELFPGSVGFTMATVDKGAWTLEVNVHNHTNSKNGKNIFPIRVVSPPIECKAVYRIPKEAPNTLYYVFHYFPEKIKVGINTFEIMVFTKTPVFADQNYLPAENLTVKFSPKMITTGDASENNENPAHTVGAYYQGKVNFSKAGDWNLNIEVFDNKNNSLGTSFFGINVP